MNIIPRMEILWPLVQVVLVYISSVNSSNPRKGYSHPAADFNYHTIVKPILYHKKPRERINTTKESNGFHVDHLFISLNVDGEKFELDLVLNKQLLGDGFFHQYQENGTDKIFRHDNKDSELCEYHGKVRGKVNSLVALSTCEGINGVIFDGKELHYISSQRIDSNSATNCSNIEHFFYSHSNLASHNKSCGEKNPQEHILRYKRNLAENNQLRGPYNADKLSKYVELILVIDNSEYNAFGRNRYRIVQHGKSIINLVNAFYSPLNIFIVLIGIVIWSERDKIRTDGDSTLSDFAHYRKNELLKYHPNDNAQLLGKFDLAGSVVGRAYAGEICSFDKSVGVNEDHSDVIGIVAGTIAHELGHNLGMHHDDGDCKCPEKKCIMSPVSTNSNNWSSCSLKYLLVSFTHGLDYCLRNEPKKLLDYPICGNGFVETGEQCDCGLPAYCNNTCCNATTCMLNSNASCASGNCCDLSVCKMKNAGTLCRSADYECDLPEYCTGQSEFCPGNTYKMDTELCDNGKAYCYQGYCRTRTDQCKLLWGLSGESCDERTYNQNLKGTELGNCGYNQFRQTFTKCRIENILCGLLHCRTLNDNPNFGLWKNYYSYFSSSNGTFILCRTISSDFGADVVDPAMVPNGAPCGNDKMCVDQKCISINSLRRDGRHCSHNCNNGWCNNLGHCHCKDGYSPPSCDSTGPGGSEDSGPATFINQHQLHLLELFLILLGILLIVATCVIICYCLRRNGVHEKLMGICPSVYSFQKSLGYTFTNAFRACNCSGWFNKKNSENNQRIQFSERYDRDHKPEIIIEPAVLVSTSNPEGVMNSLYIAEARENLKINSNNRSRDSPQIATISYPQSGKKGTNVKLLAKAFENTNFNGQFI